MPQPASIPPLRVGVLEAARIIGVSRARLYKHVQAGQLRPVKDGKRTLFTMRELERFVTAADPAHGVV